MDKVPKPSNRRIDVFRIDDFFFFVKRDKLFLPLPWTVSTTAVFVCDSKHRNASIMGCVELCQIL